jgi:hypothetical protein
MAAKKKVTRLTNVTPSKEEKAIARASDAARSKKTSAVRAGKAANATSLGDVAVAGSLEAAAREDALRDQAASRKADEALAGSGSTTPKRVKEGTFKGLGQDKGDLETGTPVVKAFDDIAARIPTSKHANITSVVRDPWGSGKPVVSEGTGMFQYTSKQGTSYGQSDEDTHRRLLRTAKDAHPNKLATAKRLLGAHLEKTHAYGLPSLCEGPTCRTEIPFESDQDYCAGDSCKTETQRSTPTPRPGK